MVFSVTWVPPLTEAWTCFPGSHALLWATKDVCFLDIAMVWSESSKPGDASRLEGGGKESREGGRKCQSCLRMFQSRDQQRLSEIGASSKKMWFLTSLIFLICFFHISPPQIFISDSEYQSNRLKQCRFFILYCVLQGFAKSCGLKEPWECEERVDIKISQVQWIQANFDHCTNKNIQFSS